MAKCKGLIKVIIPQAWIGYESTAHEAIGLVYWLMAHMEERN